MPQTDLAILNWRREKSVFLGTNQPQEDASWIFQLRMAELERAKSGRTSEPRPWQRLAARLFDYAIWGLVLALLLSELQGRRLGARSTSAYLLGHPLIAPIVITGTWIPIEALLIASIGTTPGKWLFGVYLQFSISDAYARRDTQAQLERALRRAFRVWWEGMAFGFPLLAPILIAVGYEKLDAEPGDRLGLRAGRAGDARAARRAQCRDRRVRPRGDAVAVRRRVAPADGRVDRLGADDDRRRDSLRRARSTGGLIADGGLISGLCSSPSMALAAHLAGHRR